MIAEELYKALKEIEKTMDAAERERLIKELVKRIVEYDEK